MFDYSHHVGIVRNSLFYLQWNFINPNILKPKPAPKVTHNKGVSKKQVKTGGKRKEETGDAF